MNNKSLPLFLALSFSLVLGLFVVVERASFASAAEEAPAVKVSDYAPADDLVAAQKYFLTQIEESLSSKEDYAEDTQERVKKNALVFAVLSMHLGLHDSKNDAQTAAPMNYKLALELAKNVKDYTAAKTLFDILPTLQSQKATGLIEHAKVYEGPALKWEMVRGQGSIMKKMNEISASIKRNIAPTKFEKQLDTLKHQSATMAALGQATFLDKHHVKDPTEHPTYEKYALEFRTAAADLNKAVHATDQAAALKAFTRMDTSCHTCHKKYDPPK